jgi:hypothetical protein
VIIFGITLSSSGYAVDEKHPEHFPQKMPKLQLRQDFCYPGDDSCSLRKIENGDWTNVSELLETLPSNNEQINAALIARLEKETIFDKKVDHETNRAYGGYYMDLLQRVSSIDDPRIIESLVDSLSSASGVHIPDSLAKFGDKSLKVLMKKYDEAQDTDLRNGILFTIERIIQQNAAKKGLSSNVAEYENLKALLLRALQDAEPFVREQAISVLITLGDHTVIPHLEKLAKHDTYQIRGGGEGSDLGESVVIYPLRKMAEDAIEKLKPATPLVGSPSSLALSIVGKNNNYAEIRKQVLQTPVRAERSLKTLAKYLIKPARNDIERAYAIFYWLTQNIAYDTQGFFSGNYGDLSPAGVLRSRQAVCSGYSRLFSKLAKEADLEVVEITGVSKGYGFSGNNKLGDHSWNAVKINGQWRLLDATWGAGFVTKGGQFTKRLDDFYFLTSPAQFIYNHFPQNSRWQLLNPTISKTQFKKLVYLRPAFFKYGLALDKA